MQEQGASPLGHCSTGEEGLGEVRMRCNSCVGLREQPREPGEGLPSPVSVPAAVGKGLCSPAGQKSCRAMPTHPQGALRGAMRALLRRHLRAQVHRGYLDDPRNTDNAWVETVAISVHFDTQNDVEMKRLNSVQGCHPSELPDPLTASLGHRSHISSPRAPQDWDSLAAVGEERGDERGVAPQ